LVAARRWTLSGKDGTVLTETITLRSTNAKALKTWFKDSIPTTITNTVQALHFRITPAKIANLDPVVEWYVRLRAHGSLTVGYVAAVPPLGATTERLASWAKGLDVVEEQLNRPGPKATPSATPRAAAPASTPATFPTPTRYPQDPFPTSPPPPGPSPSPSLPGPSPSPPALGF
jgi:hypothetical protein